MIVEAREREKEGGRINQTIGSSWKLPGGFGFAIN